MGERELYSCACCAEPVIPGQAWVALNRYLIGGGADSRTFAGYREARRDDEYEWDVEGDCPDDWEWTGAVLHAGCVGPFVEMELAGSEISVYPSGGE